MSVYIEVPLFRETTKSGVWVSRASVMQLFESVHALRVSTPRSFGLQRAQGRVGHADGWNRQGAGAWRSGCLGLRITRGGPEN